MRKLTLKIALFLSLIFGFSPLYAETFQLKLKQGCNFISLPIGSSWNISQVLTSSKKQAAIWDPAAGKYLYYADDPDFNQISSFNFQKGYWVYIEDTQGLTITLTGTTPTTSSIALKTGWNQIGCPLNAEVPVEEALLPLKMGIDYVSIWRYSSSVSPWYQQYSASKKEFTTLKPGEGYWIKMLKDLNWTATFSNKPTTPAVVDDGSYTSKSNQLHAKWASSSPISPITEYKYCIGTTVGGTNILNWTSTTQNEVTVTGLILTTSVTGSPTYYFTVMAKSIAGVWSSEGYSDGIKYDRKPEFASFKPANKTSFTEEDVVPIYACITDRDGDFKSFQIFIDDTVKVPWASGTGSCMSSGGLGGTAFTYNWQTKAGDFGNHIIKIQGTDNKVEPAEQNINVFVFRKPVNTPQ